MVKVTPSTARTTALRPAQPARRAAHHELPPQVPRCRSDRSSARSHVVPDAGPPGAGRATARRAARPAATPSGSQAGSPVGSCLAEQRHRRQVAGERGRDDEGEEPAQHRAEHADRPLGQVAASRTSARWPPRRPPPARTTSPRRTRTAPRRSPRRRAGVTASSSTRAGVQSTSDRASATTSSDHGRRPCGRAGAAATSPAASWPSADSGRSRKRRSCRAGHGRAPCRAADHEVGQREGERREPEDQQHARPKSKPSICASTWVKIA